PSQSRSVSAGRTGATRVIGQGMLHSSALARRRRIANCGVRVKRRADSTCCCVIATVLLLIAGCDRSPSATAQSGSAKPQPANRAPTTQVASAVVASSHESAPATQPATTGPVQRPSSFMLIDQKLYEFPAAILRLNHRDDRLT